MTPFSLFLENARRSRGLQQKQLAHDIGINPCYISALEKGRKDPPSKKVLEKLIVVLELDDEEQTALWESVAQSESTFRLPDNMSLGEYKVVYELRKKLGSLSDGEVKILLSALALDLPAIRNRK